MADMDIMVKEREAKVLTFTVTEPGGAPVDLSAATLSFEAAVALSQPPVITKADGDFNKTQAAAGIVSFLLTSLDTDRTGQLYGELKIWFNAQSIDKSRTLTLFFESALTD